MVLKLPVLENFLFRKKTQIMTLRYKNEYVHIHKSSSKSKEHTHLWYKGMLGKIVNRDNIFFYCGKKAN